MGKTVIGSGLTVQAGVTQLANAFVNGSSLDNSVMTICQDGCVKWASGFMVQWGTARVYVPSGTEKANNGYLFSGMEDQIINANVTFYSPFANNTFFFTTDAGVYVHLSATGFYTDKKIVVGHVDGTDTNDPGYNYIANSCDTTFSWLAIGF